MPGTGTSESVSKARRRLPEWLRVHLPSGAAHGTFNRTLHVIQAGTPRENEMPVRGLHTVCAEARCPNASQCWSRGTATFMIAGATCTRGCRFCSVETARSPAPPDPEEPSRLAEAVTTMGLAHVVLTVVNRDDLADGGADHFKRCIEAIHERLPRTSIELLSSDLDGNWNALEHLLAESPLAVFAHNIECVARLDSMVRDRRAHFSKSLETLQRAKHLRPNLLTKSSLMVGLGETDDEVTEALRRLRETQVDLVTLGQYLAPGLPGTRFLEVVRYVHPDQFKAWEQQALEMGFRAAASGPLVRSSYRAGELLQSARHATALRSSRTGCHVDFQVEGNLPVRDA